MPRLIDAALLGAASGLRTFAAPTALVLRGRLVRNRARFALLAAAAGELAADKSPAIPSRTDPGALAGRAVAAAVSGNVVGGPPGAGLAAATAVAAAYAGMDARAWLATRLKLPDAVVGAAEDLVALGAAAWGSRGHEAIPEPRPPAHPTPGPDWPARPGPARRAAVTLARGVLAGAAGTAAMTAAQLAVQRATGAAPSRTPERVGRRIARDVFGRRVPRRRRPALNQAMHWGYGTAWGIPLAILARPRAAVLTAGPAHGLTVWGASLVELPALGVAPPVWEQPPWSVATDAAFHLVYGVSAAAALRVLPG